MLSRNPASFLLALILLVTPVASSAEEKPVKAKKELERIQKELKGVKKKAKEAGRKERSVLSDIERIDKSLAAKRAEVRRLEAKLSSVGREISQTGERMEDKRARVAEKEGDLAKRLRAMYKTNRAGGPWVLMVSGDYGSMLKRYKYLSVISRQDKLTIDRYSEDIDDLARYKDSLRAQRESYDRLKDARDAEARRVLTEEAGKKRLLASIRKQKVSYEAMARELEETGNRMQDLIRRLEEETRAKAGKPKPSLPGGAAPALRAGLEWPVSGKVVGLFGKQKHPEYDTYIYKKGIEIQADLGTEVRAVETAEVAFANWFKGLGLVAILRHGGDYYTVYAHLSELRVKMGDKVARGQVIATLGDTGAPSGPSLYFEVRQGSEARDPLKWLRKR